MRAECSHNSQLIRKPRIDLDKISGKNPSDGLVKPVREFAKSIIKTNNKVQKPKTYDKVINNLIYGNRWREVINEELWNLNFHQT